MLISQTIGANQHSTRNLKLQSRNSDVNEVDADVTEVDLTEADLSFRTTTSEPHDSDTTDITFSLPTRPNNDDDEENNRSMLRRTAFPLSSQQRDAELITPMSSQRVSEIFLRERCSILFDKCESRGSLFVDDMQALFDSHELTELDDAEDGDIDELPANSTTNKTPSTASSSSAKRCTVLTFGEVEIREYPIIPGDSPAGLKGPPLTIDWKPVSTVRIAHIDKYEEIRERHRRGAKQLQLPSLNRMDILRNQGFSRAEIQKSIKQANIARRQRKDTASTLKHQATYEKLESIQRKVHNLLTFGKRNKAKKEYLKKHVPSYYCDGALSSKLEAK